MLKLPKGLKKKKKGKKSKRKGEDELFTEEELDKYRKEHQQAEGAEGSVKHNEEWSKFNDLTTGVDSVLKKTQGDLDRIKSTSFFQRIPAGVKQLEKKVVKEEPRRPVVEVTEADFPQLVQAAAGGGAGEDEDHSEYGDTDHDSDDDQQDDIFDTSYVEAVERGEVKLACVPDSPDDFQDDDIFDTSHVDALIKGQEAKHTKGKKALDIGVAVEVLTGRIDNLTVTSTKRSKRVIPGDLLLDNTDQEKTYSGPSVVSVPEPVEKSLLDSDGEIPILSPIDLSVSLHTALIQQQKERNSQENLSQFQETTELNKEEEDEFDEFTLLAKEARAEVTKVDEQEIKLEPVLQESWSVFDADKNESVYAECVVEDQLVVDPYLDQDDPFDTSFADAVVPTDVQKLIKESVVLEDDDDFDPRAEEIQVRLNNRRKSSVRIHLTNPSGLRESITSDDIAVKTESPVSRDLLGGSTTDLTQLGDSPLDPVDVNEDEIDPFDTTLADDIIAPGKIELKLLEEELIGSSSGGPPIYRVPSDPDFDPRADEPNEAVTRRASRPENLIVNKNVVFNVESGESSDLSIKPKIPNPVTPYYTRELSITEGLNEEAEAGDIVPDSLTRTRSDEDLAPKPSYQTKRRHSEYPANAKGDFKASDLLHGTPVNISTKVLTPAAPPPVPIIPEESDPFDTSFATDIAPTKTELKLLTKEFSCEDTPSYSGPDGRPDLLDPSDDIFQVKALTPEPSDAIRPAEDFDPFDTSFAGDINPGRTELRLLESEFLN